MSASLVNLISLIVLTSLLGDCTTTDYVEQASEQAPAPTNRRRGGTTSTTKGGNPINWRTMEFIAKNPVKTWYLSQTDVAKMMGCGRKQARAFLLDHRIPHYLIGRTKMYFLPEILEEVEKQRWKEAVS